MKRQAIPAAPVAKRRRGEAPPLTVSRKELLVKGSDDAFRAFVHAMFVLGAHIATIRDHFGRIVGLSGVQYAILISIARLDAGGNVNVKSLADHIDLSGAFVTNETNKLFRAGLITKRPDNRDRRQVRLTVTAEGIRLLEELAPKQRDVNDVLFDCLSARQFQELRTLLPSLVDSAERAMRLADYYANITPCPRRR